jgi:hypothetical protein
MNVAFDPARLQQLKSDAHENIESYNDPKQPKALSNYTAQMKTVLHADPSMLKSLPEYLPVALFGRVKFNDAAKKQWSLWLKTNAIPSWDEFKTSVAFNNDDLNLVKAVRAYNQDLLIEACAVLFLLMHDNTKPSKALDADADADDQYNEEDDSVNNYAHDDYEGRDDVDGHDGEYDEITFN